MPVIDSEALQPAWTRFRHGAFTCTVVTDGLLHMGAPQPGFPGADPGEIDALLASAYLPIDRMDLDQNVLAVQTGEALVLFDPGAGINAQFGTKTFGPGVGRAVPNLKLAGIEPDAVDIVALTHAHPDHCWGLVDDDGRLRYPNARIMVSAIDLDYWTDLSIIAGANGDAMGEAMRDHFLGAHKNLTPYRDAGRVVALEDGQAVLSGITAHLRPGHSPGHMIYVIESEGERLTVWGDVSHHPVLLLAHPEWGFKFDHDQNEAAKARERVFADVMKARSAVLAYHFPFPGRGYVGRIGDKLHWLPAPLELAEVPACRPEEG